MAKKASKKVAKKIEKHDVTKGFNFKLTAKEKQEHADNIVRLMTERMKKELQFGDVKKKWTTEIKELETEIETHRQVYSSGKEWREVKCVMVKDFTRKEIRWHYGKDITNDKVEQIDEKTKEIRAVQNEQTSKKTKKSSVDSNSSAYNELHGGGAV